MHLKGIKGFTMIEVLVTIAVLGIMIGIAMQAFFSLIENSRTKADLQTAHQIEKAIKVLSVDSGYYDIRQNGIFYMDEACTNALDISAGTNADVIKLVEALQATIYTKDVRGQAIAHGPYLDIIDGGGYDKYKPISKKYEGYQISIDLGNKEIVVTLVEDVTALPTDNIHVFN